MREPSGGQLGVQAVFEGRVIQQGDNLAISAELVDARDNSHIWGQQYDRKFADIFALRERIAKQMTTALRMRLTGVDEKHMAKSYTVNPEAYQDYLKGRYWLEQIEPRMEFTRASNTFSRRSKRPQLRSGL